MSIGRLRGAFYRCVGKTGWLIGPTGDTLSGMKPRPLMLWVLACFAVVGCTAKIKQVDNPIPVAPAEYDRLYDASIQILRDQKFLIDQQDRRFGLITTRPRIASSVLEPWERDHSQPGQLVRSTLNYQRRIVQVHIEPRSVAEIEAGADSQVTLADTQPSDQYWLRVVVRMQRRQTPQRQPSSAAITRLTFTRGRTAPRLLTETGPRQSFWRDVGRDELMEKRLVAEILRRATRTTEPPPQPDTEPADTPEPA